MTTEKAYNYIGRIEHSMQWHTPIKAIACILHIAGQIRAGRDEETLIMEYFIQEEQEGKK